jgi:hypothetical protein
MFADVNGQENYFTRICVSGLLNTRKIELCHMLLKDINLFHTHPTKHESHSQKFPFGGTKMSFSKNPIGKRNNKPKQTLTILLTK